MKFESLTQLLKSTDGVFFCEQIHNNLNTKTIPIQHLSDPGLTTEQIEELEPVLGHIVGLVNFYKLYGGLRLFYDHDSGDSAYYVAPPSEWHNLKENFSLWIKDLDEEEQKELLPSWIHNYYVIGEIPQTGNYLLLPVDGDEAGSIYEFEHDGFEFIKLSSNFSSFIDYISTLDSRKLSNIASSMCFMDMENPMIQWWIKEYRGSGNEVIKTK